MSLSIPSILKQLKNPPAITEFTSDFLTNYISKLDIEYCDLDEATLLKLIQDNLSKPNWQPAPVVETLRQAFWDQYEIAVRYQIKIDAHKIFENICTKGVFQKHMEDQNSLAWILCKPLAYEQKIGALLDRGYRRFEEFLELPVRDKMGNVNEKLVDSIFKIVTALDLRLRGGYTQRSEQMIRQQTEIIHSGSDAKQVEAQVNSIDEKIKELERKIAEVPKQLAAPTPDAELVGLSETLDARKQ